MAVKIILNDHRAAKIEDLLMCLKLVRKASKLQSANVISLEVTWTQEGKFGGLLRTNRIVKCTKRK